MKFNDFKKYKDYFSLEKSLNNVKTFEKQKY